MIKIDNINLAQCLDSGAQSEIHLMKDAVVVWDGNLIEWVGSKSELPKKYKNIQTVDGQKALLLPGLIDCHTHLAFGGWRSDEFGERVAGVPYAEITARGGGISSTVKATRAATEDDLYSRSYDFLEKMRALGVTTVECKSGYGLSLDDEMKLLRVYRRLGESQPIRIVPTFLGAHLVPQGTTREEYCKLVVDKMIPEVAKNALAEFCDVFVDDHAFSVEEAALIVAKAKECGLQIKLHVDQLSNGKGAEFAAECGAISADHLEYISEDGIQAMKRSGTVAVSLPLATLYTFQKPLDARALIDAGIDVAIATDFNPGSAPSYHLPLAMMLGCTLNRMSPAEVLKAVTIKAAKALGKIDTIGSIEVGKKADFVLIDTPSIDHWMYHFTENANRLTVINGNTVFKA
jgi:imidazolonepropionase